MKRRDCILSGFLLISVSLCSHAQKLYSKGARIKVAANTSLTVNGSVENGGTIVNDGQLKVSGAWINSGSYELGQGVIIFNGSSAVVPQIIHHNGQKFNKVMITGGGKKTLLSDMVIARDLWFDDGVVETSGSSKVVLDEGVTISGASDRSHIHGPVYERGTGEKLFPIGDGLYYLPVTLTNVSDPQAFVGVHAFEFQHSNLQTSEDLPAISDKRYWFIDVAAGSLKSSQVVLPFRDESWTSNPADVVVAQASSPTEKFTSIGRSAIEGGPYSARITSQKDITMPFVALATEAEDLPLVVHNAVSPNGDDRNEYVIIENIENFPQNKFSVFNRWGDKVFEIENYDNVEHVFRGRSSDHGELVSGTYFYVLDLPGRESLRGFLAVKK
jgi:gliding motility-associated-like protein